MTEAELEAAIRDAAKLGGWLCYHTYDSRRSQAGFPDLVLVHGRRRRIIFAELKSDTGRLSLDQKDWLDALREVFGLPRAWDLHPSEADVVVWRPSDLDDVLKLLLPQR